MVQKALPPDAYTAALVPEAEKIIRADGGKLLASMPIGGPLSKCSKSSVPLLSSNNATREREDPAPAE